MKIKSGQLDQFLQHDEEAFVDMIINEFLKVNMPELVEDIPIDGLQEMVSNGLAKARSYGFYNDGDLIAFIAVMFETAPNFDEQPEIQKALTDTSIPIEQRFDSIFTQAPGEAWEQAEANYDSDAWFPELKESQE